MLRSLLSLYFRLKWPFRRAAQGPGLKGKRRDYLTLWLLVPGLLFLGVVIVFWIRTARIDRSFQIVSRQLELSQDLIVALRRPDSGQDAERESRAEEVREFDELLADLEGHVLADQGWFGMPTQASGFASQMRLVWSGVRQTVLSADRRNPEEVRRLATKLVTLVRTSEQLHASLSDRKDALRRWLLLACTGVSCLSLVMLYAAVTLAKTFVASSSRLMRTALERSKGRLLLEASSILTEEDLRQLPDNLPGVSDNLGPVLEFVQQHCRNVEKILHTIPYGLLVVSGDLRVRSANRFLQDQLGMPLDVVIGRALGEAFPSPFLVNAARRVLQTGAPEGDLSVKLSSAGRERLCRVSLARIQQGNPVEMCLLARVEDITELNEVRTARREFEELNRQFLENVAEPVIVADDSCRIAGLNGAAEQMLGFAREDLAGESVELLTPGSSAAAPGRQLVALLSSGIWKLDRSVLDLDLRKKDGTVFPAQLRPRVCRTGTRTYFLINLRDVSDHRCSELLAKDRLEVIEMIAKNRALDAVLGRLTQMVERQFPDTACAVMLRRDDRLYAAAAPSLPEAFVKALDGLAIGPNAASCGAAALRGTIVTSADIAEDPAWASYREQALAHGFRACYSAPIHASDGTIVGTVAIYGRRPGGLESRQTELLQTASRLAAVSLEQKQLNGKLAYQAQHDALTGLANRFTFQEHMKRAIARSRRTGIPSALLSVDLDRFKLVNDTLGHATGDGLLQQVAVRLLSSVRETDIVARWGGDEFILGLCDLKHIGDAHLVAQKLVEAMRSPFDVDGHELVVTATIGVAVCPHDGQDLTELLKNADRAMYRAKRQGRNNFVCYRPDMGEEAGHPLELAAHLRRALERGELVLYYQPQFELVTGRLVGLEALLRWNHPRLGMVPPAKFIPVAEETGLIVPIGAWVIEQGCRQASAWRHGKRPVKVAVNVSTLQCARSDFVKVVRDILDKSGVEPGSLELEMTESLVMRNVEESSRRLAKLRELGVSIAVDDFGTGYSSLSCLLRLPIDTLKIDQSFVRDIAAPSSTLPLVEYIIGMARSLGMRAIAEGVETDEQLSALRGARCDFVQGYLLGKPCLAAELPTYAEPLLSLIGHSRPQIVPASPPHRPGVQTALPAQPFPARQPVRPRPANLSVIRPRGA